MQISISSFLKLTPNYILQFEIHFKLCFCFADSRISDFDYYIEYEGPSFEQPIELYNTFLHCVGINESIGASVVTNNCFHLCHMLRAETIESVTNGIDTKINYGKEHMSLRMKKPLEYVSVSKIQKINKWITKSP